MKILYDGIELGTYFEKSATFGGIDDQIRYFIDDQNEETFKKYVDNKQLFRDISAFSSDFFKIHRGKYPIYLAFEGRSEYLFKYIEKVFIETGTHPLIISEWIPFGTRHIFNYREFSDYMKGFIMDIVARRRLGSTNFDDIVEHYEFKLPKFFEIRSWMKLSPYNLKRRIEQSTDSFIANILGISYEKSKRSVTSMSGIVRVLNHIKVIKFDKDNSSGAPVKVVGDDGRSLMVIPVTRYSINSKGGGFFDNTISNASQINKLGLTSFCGTYYYWEPESHIYLIMGKSIYFTNKIAAAMYFAPNDPENIINEVIRQFTHKIKGMWVQPDPYTIIENKEMKNDFIKMLIEDNYNSPLLTFDNAFIDKTTNKYVGSNFYALEDSLDQYVCVLARKAGYDTVIFSRMPGHRRVVTEILDSRDRDNSLKNLAWESQ
jgi:hypothetical protein